ncbi:FAD-dependent oxidoreductase [Streptomyces sp. FXJ1.172]|uniref:FAD-dependent oxidoreductase n=1 Tax=Streptomyces sp. FXJ1.172 TaxID=710705 RepID=UPI0007CF57FD|nr:FAD-dependent oxidoreductase [Streptomyces sp. FXJ1.172]WEO93657.1 FAD-dependent oxidoreductase [Streptomyces sp. FXJ1.172]
MTVTVDLNRCQSYGQCTMMAPDVFRFSGEESLEYDHVPPAAEDENVARAVAACPVQAITVGQPSALAGVRRRGGPVAAGQGGGPRRIVVVGASLAGLRAVEALRDEGFTGDITVIGDEPHEPYDRPPLSKAVLTGRLDIEHVLMARPRDAGVRWLLGTAAGLDAPGRRVMLADGRVVPYDRLLIATGVRARELPGQDPAVRGVHRLRGRDDAERLRADLAAGPRRVLIVGGGLIGSEVAGACRSLGLPVTLVHRGPSPLSGALGTIVGGHAAGLQRDAGVDLRLESTVTALETDGRGRLRRARLSAGSGVDTDVAVISLGAVANVEWLRGAGLEAGPRGVVCDAKCRVLRSDGSADEEIFAAGDVTRWPHPLYDGRLISLGHWGNAVAQAQAAAHNMTCAPSNRRDYAPLPAFWSDQFGANIKVVGVPSLADSTVLTQGSLADGRFVVAYGLHGRLVAAAAVNSPRVLDGYAALIRARAPFPPRINAGDSPPELIPQDAGFSGAAGGAPRPLVPSSPLQ